MENSSVKRSTAKTSFVDWSHDSNPSRSTLGAYGKDESKREFVIDIDLTDYPSRSCECDVCCKTCWQTYIVPAVRTLDYIFFHEWGVRRVLWVFSGRRGVHAWLLDDALVSLDNVARSHLTHLSGDLSTQSSEDVQPVGRHVSTIGRQRLATTQPQPQVPV